MNENRPALAPPPAALGSAPALDPRPALTPRQEAFCHAYVCWGSAALAAREAGYAARSSRQRGHRLLRHVGVAARIAQIREHLAREGCRNMDVLLGKLESVYCRALESYHFAAAARAVEIQARLAGMTPSPLERLAAAARGLTEDDKMSPSPRAAPAIPRTCPPPVTLAPGPMEGPSTPGPGRGTVAAEGGNGGGGEDTPGEAADT